MPFKHADGEWVVEMLDAQDIMSWIAQGEIADRSIETLASADRGVTLYRRMRKNHMQFSPIAEDLVKVFSAPQRAVAGISAGA